MINGLYSAASALETAKAKYEAIANNLANISTPGYRRQYTIVEPLVRDGTTADSTMPEAGPTVTGLAFSFQPGELRYTGNSLDLAIVGDGFFSVQTPNGTLYTRNGAFTLDQQRRLVTQSGFPVLGQGGPIMLPVGTEITVKQDGTIFVDGLEAGRLQIVRFEDESKLVAAGTTLFQATPEAGLTNVQEPNVRQGYREMSNVNPVSELVNLIVTARLYEAAQRTLQALSEAVQQNVNPAAQ